MEKLVLALEPGQVNVHQVVFSFFFFFFGLEVVYDSNGGQEVGAGVYKEFLRIAERHIRK